MKLIAFVLAAGLVFAQQRPIVLKAARMFDGVSDRVVSPGLVVVFGDKIRAIGSNAEIPPGSQTIDLGDATLLPGFMDAHTHLTFTFTTDFRQQELDNFKKPITERAIESTVNARITLMAGFTTVRDVGSADYMDVGLRNAINNGVVPGPRMLVAVHAIGSTGGHCDDAAGYKFNVFGRESGIQDGVVNNPDEARAAVRFNIKYGADVIKTCATGGVLSLADDVDTPQLTQAELDALVSEAHALRRKTAAHAHGAEGAKRAIRAGIDSIEHGSFMDDEALDLMKARGTYYVPTMMAVQGLKETLERGYLPPQIAAKARAAMAALDATVSRAIAKGVKIALGTDATVYPHGRNAGEMAQLVRVGMKPIDVLKAATSADAVLLGVAQKTGTLEAGKLADIVAVPGNPIDDISVTQRVLFVMKEGTVYKNEKR
jgi:imidazolonepropionase-like amidohydrolase